MFCGTQVVATERLPIILFKIASLIIPCATFLIRGERESMYFPSSSHNLLNFNTIFLSMIGWYLPPSFHSTRPPYGADAPLPYYIINNINNRSCFSICTFSHIQSLSSTAFQFSLTLSNVVITTILIRRTQIYDDDFFSTYSKRYYYHYHERRPLYAAQTRQKPYLHPSHPIGKQVAPPGIGRRIV